MQRILMSALLPALLLAFDSTAVAADAVDAAKIYAESCSVCHGDDGSGAVWGRESLAVPPRNFRTTAAQMELTRERMLASVAAGRPGTPMPGFSTQLNGDEIAAVVDFIREEFMQADAGAHSRNDRLPGNSEYGPIGPRIAIPGSAQGAEYSGDPSRGAVLYASNCVACHGANGRGDGPRAYFIFPKPRDFHDPATRAHLDRRSLYNGIKFGVVGKEMPAWGKVLDDGQIADVAEYVFRQFIQEAPAGDSSY